ncbi:MAG: YfhO family protein [Planctomycetes bacterium]|nr:YfhO family protein [Planctomycetota bacterium]MCB9905319.1 YfhO family protein [Planctomycetota bacterium]
MRMDVDPATTHTERPRWRRVLLLVLPLMLVGPSLLPGKRFLPVAPVCFEPLAAEHPDAARAAWEDANHWTADALFPALTDEVAVRAAVESGHLPLWTPLAGLGAPLAAGSIAGVWYPPRWLWTWLPPDLATGWHALLAVFLAGLGMQLFLERRGASTTAALLGALALQGSGFGVANLHLAMKYDAALWLPWALWAVEGLFAGRRGAPFALAFAIACSFLAGFVPIAIFVALTAAAYLFLRSLSTHAWRAGLLGAVCLVLGVGLSALQTIPTLEASENSLRRPTGAEVIAQGSVPSAALLTLVAPKLYGVPTENRFAPGLGTVWDFTEADDAELAQRAVLLEWNLAAGVLIALLAATGLAGGGRRAIFPGLLALAVLTFVCGQAPASWLYGLPGFDLGAPTRAAAILWVLWPWLAALGVDALRGGAKAPRRALLAGVAVCVACGANWWLATDGEELAERLYTELPARLDVERDMVELYLPREALADDAARVRDQGFELLLFALAGGAAAWMLRKPRVAWIAGALLCAEAASLAHTHLAPLDLGGVDFVPPSERMAALQRVTDDGRLLRYDSSESGLDEVLNLARPNLPQLYDAADLSTYQVFTPRWQVELMALVDPRSPYLTGASRISDAELLDHQLLDRLGVNAVLSQHDLDRPELKLYDSAEGWRLYRRHGSLPIARVVPTLEYCSNDSTALELLATHALDPNETATVVPDGPGGAAPGEAPALDPLRHRKGTLQWARPSADRFDVSIQGSGGGWLVVREAWYPGWRATVSGEPAEVLRVDHAFRAVRVPGGDVEVEFVYRPVSFRRGLWISALSLLVALASWLRPRPGVA